MNWTIASYREDRSYPIEMATLVVVATEHAPGVKAIHWPRLEALLHDTLRPFAEARMAVIAAIDREFG